MPEYVATIEVWFDADAADAAAIADDLGDILERDEPGLRAVTSGVALGEVGVSELDSVNACVAAFARRGVPIERDELVGVAQVAYARALTTYRPSAGASFRSWAWQAMWRGMLDECRRVDPHSRPQRRAIREGRVPTTHGGREVPLITVGELREDLYGSLDIAATVAARLDLLAALGSLPARLRSIMLWRAFGYSQKEIGAAMGVTEGRVCQIEVDARRRIARFA